MIYPARLAVLTAAVTAPLTLLIALSFPAFWTAGLALIALLIALCTADAFSGAGLSNSDVQCEGPRTASVGETFAVIVRARYSGRAPSAAQIALGIEGPVSAPFGWSAQAITGVAGAEAAIMLKAKRRGTARIDAVWIRWRSPLGLVWKQRQFGLDQSVLITPDIRPVREKAAQLMNREAMHGQVAQLQVGEGAEFEALTDFRRGMDRRSIDWKMSARHTMLIAKEYRTERNNNVVMALDSGRSMCEPLGGVPRIDRAVSAALLTAYMALKDGDRVGFFAFDSHPRASSRPISGERTFALLQRIAAGIDYSARETNYTLAMATLAESLSRRSLIVVFTEFADSISAELMIQAVGSLLKRHLVLFVVLNDEELEAFTAAEPGDADDVSRAVTAASLLRERRLVMTRLRHLGVHVIEAAAAEAGPALVKAYLELKRRSLI